jgi:hypothetical protein
MIYFGIATVLTSGTLLWIWRRAYIGFNPRVLWSPVIKYVSRGWVIPE